MQPEFKNLLPPSLWGLIDEIEAAASAEIRVAENPYPPDPSNANPLALGAQLKFDYSVWIYYRDKNAFPPNLVLHELLHLHRWIVQKVPQVYLNDDAPLEYRNMVETTENLLEHTVIVPREISYGLGSEIYWNDLVKKLLASNEASKITDFQAKRNLAVRASLDAEYCVTDPTVKAAVAKRIEELGQADFACEFIRQYRKSIKEKPRAARLVLKFQKAPMDLISLLYMDFRNKKTSKIKLA